MCLCLDSIKIISFLTYDELVKACFYSFGELISTLEKASKRNKKMRLELNRERRLNCIKASIFISTTFFPFSYFSAELHLSREKVTLRNE